MSRCVHCVSLCVIVCQCVSVCVTVFHCLSLCAIMCHWVPVCVSQCAILYHCVSLSVTVYSVCQCVQLCAIVCTHVAEAGPGGRLVVAEGGSLEDGGGQGEHLPQVLVQLGAHHVAVRVRDLREHV